MSLTPEAKKLLAETIRGTQQDPSKGLRANLLNAIRDEADRRYRLSVSIEDAGLDEAHRRRRERIEAWIDERARASKPKSKGELNNARTRLRVQAEKEAAATLINRLVLLRQLEAQGLSKPPVLTGGWNSKGYREFREFAPTLCTNGTTDATEGYGALLQLVFDELAIDIPGLFGNVGLTRLFPIPAATLRDVVERLDNPELASAWSDDTALGWVYQYWNDPDREALDAKINGGGKIEPHEIASKTQMFTERYMVEWLLQNSLGLTWLCMCKKQEWRADAESVLTVLDARRAEWRKKRDAGEVALDALMPIEGELEDHWKYYVPQPLPEDAVEKAPESVRAIKLLDPACGSGHFLVIAFGLLAALYREEARHRGQSISDKEIAESILEYNLHGIDIDPRAIQIAAAGLYLKAKAFAKNARPRHVNLVAPVLQLGNLPADEPAVIQLRDDLKREVGIPEDLTSKLLCALGGVDYLGSLLKVDAAVENALRSEDLEFERVHGQGDLFGGVPAQQLKPRAVEAKANVLSRLEHFLMRHSRSEDLGFRLDGEQLAAGVRFVRMAKEGAYDIVVGNPPYHGIGKLRDSAYYTSHYGDGRADLLAGFYIRGLELTRDGGVCAYITLSNWMFLSVYRDLRRAFQHHTIRVIADLGKAAFTTGGTLISTACAVLTKAPQVREAIALRPHPPDEVVRDDGQPVRTRAALLLQRGRHDFDPRGFAVIEGGPMMYWWTKAFLARYAAAPKLGDLSPARKGIDTGDNTRFVRRPWEVMFERLALGAPEGEPWVPYILGGKGRAWLEPLSAAVYWRDTGLQVRVFAEISSGCTLRNVSYFFRKGVAFSPIGSQFVARVHRYASICDNKGTSLYGHDLAQIVSVMNTKISRFVVESLNPTVSFQNSDAERIPVFPVPDYERIFAILSDAFAVHEAHRETSVEFRGLGPSPWIHAQKWADSAINRTDNDALPFYSERVECSTPADVLSYVVGVALGRFTPTGLEGHGRRAQETGILFVSAEGTRSLEHAGGDRLRREWAANGTKEEPGGDLGSYLRKAFFIEHKQRYENRPIYFPLSSGKKSFVAFVSIHRWQDDTLNVLLADHLVPTKRRLDGELDDLRTARALGSNKGKAEKRYAEVQKLVEELNEFISKVTEVAEKGPPPPDDKTPKREIDARYVMDLDDGVMVNSAALWPLLEPQWKDPKKWWKELATAQGKKDYDWSHLAARYFPTRVRKKCHDDPSLAVAHKCFWELHPAKAYAWELRLQDEIRPDFTIDEPASEVARTKFLADHAEQAKKILAKELKRREKKAAKEEQESDDGPLFDGDYEVADVVDADA